MRISKLHARCACVCVRVCALKRVKEMEIETFQLTHEMRNGLGETYLQDRKQIVLVCENGINAKNFNHKLKLQNNFRATTIAIAETNFSNYAEFIEFLATGRALKPFTSSSSSCTWARLVPNSHIINN